MEKERLFRTAVRLENMIRLDSGDISPNDVYTKLIELSSRVPYYFETFKPKHFLKLCILIYSLKKTGSFSLASQILSKMRYIGFVVTENENAQEECYECSGNGYQSCDECDGSGQVSCNECNGNGYVDCEDCGGGGEISCDTCDGTGEDEEGNTCGDCNGEGELKCTNCGGEGTQECSECEGNQTVYCEYCSGDGSRDCSECEGSGEVDSDEKVNFRAISCVSWDENINNLCEIRENEDESVMEIDSLIENKNILTLEESSEVGVPEFSLNDDELYCYYFQSDTKVLKNVKGKLYFRGKYDYENYFD